MQTTWREPPARYGTTETLTINTAFPSETPREITAGSHGEPLPGNTLKIVDPLTGAVVPRGERGEIAVKGPTLMLGYVGMPNDETLDAEGFFHTGDGGYLDEAGRLFWEGRLTDIIKTGGANVSPREIDERARDASRRQAAPRRSACRTRRSARWWCPASSRTRAPRSTRRRSATSRKERLASYKVPRRVLFLREDELAMTGSEKVKAGALRELAGSRELAAFLATAELSHSL